MVVTSGNIAVAFFSALLMKVMASNGSGNNISSNVTTVE